MMHSVKKINFIDGFKISLTFNDKKIKIVDLEPYLDKGIFLALRDFDYFKLVKIKYETLVWPNEADFCPDVLYKIGRDVTEDKKLAKTQIPARKQRKKTDEKSLFKYQKTAAAMKVSRKTQKLPKT